MRKFAMVLLLLSSRWLRAQDQIAAGTVLPIMLMHTVDARHDPTGTPIRARLMQSVRTSRGKLREGSTISGTVESVSPDGKQMSMQFDRISHDGKTISVVTTLRALASYMDVEQALIPPMGTDRMTPYEDATLVLIGGDVSYRGGGPVMHGDQSVGKPDGDGILVRMLPNTERGCVSAYDSQTVKQSLWVFSSNACGVYGINNIRIAHRGLESPLGTFSLSSKEDRISLHSGDGLLLTVVKPSR